VRLAVTHNFQHNKLM